MLNIEDHLFKADEFRAILDGAVTHFARTPLIALSRLDGYGNRFNGVGVYALYYFGSAPHYRNRTPMTPDGTDRPIYVGKAVPSGWRTARTLAGDEMKLSGRIREHLRSIRQTETLDVEDFAFRVLIMDTAAIDLISTLEAELVRRYTPEWNCVIDGFGNHDPGKGRYAQSPSEWDILHPGRTWAQRLTGISPNLEQVEQKLR